MKATLLAILAAVPLAPAASAASAVVPVEHHEPGWHVLDTWRQPQGLPQNTVITLLQTRDGYLWIGTKGGVARFDGVRFTVYDDSDRSRLRENEVWALAEGDDDAIWIATYGGGVTRFHENTFTVFTARDGLANDYATSLCNDRDGGLWIGTDRGLSRYAGGTFTTFTTDHGLPSNIIRSLYRDRDGSVWVGTDKGGLAVFRDGRFEAPALEGARPRAGVTGIHRDLAGTLWLVTSEGLFRLRDDELRRFSHADGLAADRIRRVFEDPQGRLWIVSAAGVDRVHPRPDGGLEVEPVVRLPNLSAATLDREGSLWLGSLTEGLTRLHQGLFVSYTQAQGIADDYVSTVLEDGNGNVWVGTGRGLMRFVEGRFVAHGLEGGLPDRLVFSLLLDHQQRLWVSNELGTFRASVSSCRPARCTPRFEAVRADGLPVLGARVLYEDRRHVLWAGLNNDGLARYQDGKLTLYTTEHGLPSNAVRALLEDREGSLWIGTRGGGLGRFRDGEITVFSEKDGLVNDGIQALYLDDAGAIWIGTRQGVSRLENGRFVNYTAGQGLFANFVYSFLDDGAGSLWMTCAKGIFRVPRAELDDVAAGRRDRVTSIAYGLEHGLASAVAVVGHHPASFRTRDGRLWFGTNSGLSIVDPKRVQTNRRAPPIHIEELKVDDREVPLTGDIHLPPGRGDLEIRYTGLSFLAPEKVRFKYRLEGYDRDWIDAGTRRVAYYTNIPPGAYRFHVKGANSDGVWNDGGAGFAVTLAPHFYQTYWFAGLCLIVVGLLGALTQHLRVVGLQARERELSKRVEESIAQIKVLRGLLPICASCKKIRDDSGYWSQMETYIHAHSQAEFSHSICPECMEKLYPEFIVRGDAPSS